MELAPEVAPPEEEEDFPLQDFLDTGAEELVAARFQAAARFRALDLERSQALSAIAMHTELPVSMFADRLTKRAAMLDKAPQAIPSELRTLSRQDFSPYQFKAEFDLLQEPYKWCDLTDRKTVQAWQMFYAKMCVIEQMIESETNADLNAQKLAPLFKDERFRNVLERAMFLFGDLSTQTNNPDATRILHTLSNITRCWNDYKAFRYPEYTLLPIHTPDAIPLDPATQDKLREITSGSMKKNPKPSSVKRVALDIRQSKDISYVDGWKEKERRDLFSIDHVEKDMASLRKGGTFSLRDEKDAIHWQSFYAKMRVFELKGDNASLKDLQFTYLPIFLYNAINFFQSLSTEDPNALMMVSTFENVLLKIISDHGLASPKEMRKQYDTLHEEYIARQEAVNTSGLIGKGLTDLENDYIKARHHLRKAHLELEFARLMSLLTTKSSRSQEIRPQLAKVEADLIAFNMIEDLSLILTHKSQ